MRSVRSCSWPLAALLAVGCSPSPDSQEDPRALGSRIDEVFAEFTAPGSPGAVAMVIKQGEVIHANGYGLAELGTDRALSPRTPVRLGSVGKQFTSMAIMILADRGQLAFDDPVVTWVPELTRFPGIEIQHLLRHTSGLPDYYELPRESFEDVAGFDGDPVLTNQDVITFFESWGEAEFDPGDMYQYSNPGYETLALIVERVSGETFGDFLMENVFEPLGMETAVVRDRPEVDISDRAVGYRPDDSDNGWVENDDHYGNWLVGAGGVYASLDDFVKWDQALYTDTLVSQEIMDLAFSPTTLNDGSISNYGFGWRVDDRLGHRAIHHGGSWVGFRTAILRFVDQETTVVVLSNASASAGDLADQVAEIVLAAGDQA